MAAVLSEVNEAKRFGGAEAVKAFVAARAASTPEEWESLLSRSFDSLRRTPHDPELDPELDPAHDLALEARLYGLSECIELCIERQRQTTESTRAELERQRRQLGEQRREMSDWLHDGLSVIQRRLDEAAQTHQSAAEAQIKSTTEALARCRRDLEGLVEAVRRFAAQTRLQEERLADAAIAANLTLRHDVELSTRSLRSALGSQQRRTERIERVVSGALVEQRRFTTRMVIALALAQAVGLAAVVVLG
jgi:hypothetical protein